MAASSPDSPLCSKGHPMITGTNKYRNGVWICNHCEKRFDEPRPRKICEKCSFDLCDICAPRHINTKQARCEEDHILSLRDSTFIGWICNKCREGYGGWRWRCRECDYDVCVHCYEKLPAVSKAPPKPKASPAAGKCTVCKKKKPMEGVAQCSDCRCTSLTAKGERCKYRIASPGKDLCKRHSSK